MTFGKELTVTQPRKLTGDGRGDQTHMHTQKRVHFRQTKKLQLLKNEIRYYSGSCAMKKPFKQAIIDLRFACRFLF